MHRVGLSFVAGVAKERVYAEYIRPLREELDAAGLGFYSNHLCEPGHEEGQPTEHLVVFQVSDFKQGLRLLREQVQKLPVQHEFSFHNLDPADPGY